VVSDRSERNLTGCVIKIFSSKYQGEDHLRKLILYTSTKGIVVVEVQDEQFIMTKYGPQIDSFYTFTALEYQDESVDLGYT
jgi:hypothetical protein